MKCVFCEPVIHDSSIKNIADDKPSKCSSDDEVKCYYQWINTRKLNGINTKDQINSYKSVTKQKCRRIEKLSTKLYFEMDQDDPRCMKAVYIPL